MNYRITKKAGDRKTYIMMAGYTSMGGRTMMGASMTNSITTAQVYTKEKALEIIEAMKNQNLELEEAI